MSSQADLLATPGLLPAEPDSLDSEFAAIDSNGDGKLSWEETLAFFSKRGVKKNEARKLAAFIGILSPQNTKRCVGLHRKERAAPGKSRG